MTIPTSPAPVELTMDERRAVTEYAVACAQPVLHLFDQACPQDRRPAIALDAARAFAEGGRRSRRQRTATTDAHRAGREAASEAARHARCDDPVVAHYMLDAAAKRATATVRDVRGR